MLKPFLHIFFSLSLALLVRDARGRPSPRHPPPPPVVDYQWDLFILTQQWPPAFCPYPLQCFGPSHSVLDYFTIEGFWPYNHFTGVLSDCTGSTFDLDSYKIFLGNLDFGHGLWIDFSFPYDKVGTSLSVSKFQEDLDFSWPSLYDGITNEELWKREWNKYGTCSESILNQTAYFHAALVLKDHFNLLDILAKSGIVPNGSYYSYLDIFQAITNGVNLRPLLKCRRQPILIWPPRYVLTSISLCADKDGKSFVDCPPQHDQLICGQKDLPFIEFYKPILDKKFSTN